MKHQTDKGARQCFGMKAHIGVAGKTRLCEPVEQVTTGKDVVVARGDKPVARLTRLLLDAHNFIRSVMASRQLKAATRS